MNIKFLGLLIVALIIQACCCGDMDKSNYEELIPPVKVAEKYDSHLVLKDAKDNTMNVTKMHRGWSDSVYRNHKVGDIVGRKSSTSTIKKDKDDWLD